MTEKGHDLSLARARDKIEAKLLRSYEKAESQGSDASRLDLWSPC
jgi:hypothetical protein